MEIIKSSLLKQFPELIFGISTRTGLGRQAPFFFNTSLTVGDNEKLVWENRDYFFNKLGLTRDQIIFQRQIHSDIITLVIDSNNSTELAGNISGSRIYYKDNVISADTIKKGIEATPFYAGECDAMITNLIMTGLTVSTADCTPIFIYDKKNKVIAGIHSGWRGTVKRILYKTLHKMNEVYNSKPEYLYCFIGPCISQKNYEVGEEVASEFSEKYLFKKPNGKYLLDLKKANHDMIIEFGVPEPHIEVSPICSLEDNNLQSYRRDGEKSGRSLGVIALKG